MISLLKNIAPFILYICGIIMFFAALTGRVRAPLIFLTILFPLQNVLEKLHQFPLGKDLNDLIIIGIAIGWIISKNGS